MELGGAVLQIKETDLISRCSPLVSMLTPMPQCCTSGHSASGSGVEGSVGDVHSLESVLTPIPKGDTRGRCTARSGVRSSVSGAQSQC